MSMRPTAETPSPEPAILRARVEGSLSAPAKFAPAIGPERRPMVSSLAELAGVLPFHDRHHLGRIAAWRASLR